MSHYSATPLLLPSVLNPDDPDLFIAWLGSNSMMLKRWSRHRSRDDAAMVGARLVSGHVDADGLDARRLHRQEVPPGLSFSAAVFDLTPGLSVIPLIQPHCI